MLEVAHDERQKAIRSIAEVLHEETDRLHHRSNQKSPLTGTPSGFRDLDDITGGFQPGNLVVLAARPSMGKSALVANIAENAALGGFAAALFSLAGSSRSELAQRFVASQAKVPGDDLRRGRVAESRWPKILEASGKLSEAPLYVDDSSDTGVLEVRAKSRRLHHQLEERGGLEDDHHRLPTADAARGPGREPRRTGRSGQSRAKEPRARAQGASDRALAAEPQRRAAWPATSRSSPTSENPVRSSRTQILVMFIYREEYYNRESTRPGEGHDIIIAKHRNGAVGEITLTFQSQFPKFMNYAPPQFAG